MLVTAARTPPSAEARAKPLGFKRAVEFAVLVDRFRPKDSEAGREVDSVALVARIRDEEALARAEYTAAEDAILVAQPDAGTDAIRDVRSGVGHRLRRALATLGDDLFDSLAGPLRTMATLTRRRFDIMRHDGPAAPERPAALGRLSSAVPARRSTLSEQFKLLLAGWSNDVVADLDWFPDRQMPEEYALHNHYGDGAGPWVLDHIFGLTGSESIQAYMRQFRLEGDAGSAGYSGYCEAASAAQKIGLAGAHKPKVHLKDGSVLTVDPKAVDGMVNLVGTTLPIGFEACGTRNEGYYDPRKDDFVGLNDPKYDPQDPRPDMLLPWLEATIAKILKNPQEYGLGMESANGYDVWHYALNALGLVDRGTEMPADWKKTVALTKAQLAASSSGGDCTIEYFDLNLGSKLTDRDGQASDHSVKSRGWRMVGKTPPDYEGPTSGWVDPGVKGKFWCPDLVYAMQYTKDPWVGLSDVSFFHSGIRKPDVRLLFDSTHEGFDLEVVGGKLQRRAS